jgi:hypothetical protein
MRFRGAELTLFAAEVPEEFVNGLALAGRGRMGYTQA